MFDATTILAYKGKDKAVIMEMVKLHLEIQF